jgi:hypothetical protein
MNLVEQGKLPWVQLHSGAPFQLLTNMQTSKGVLSKDIAHALGSIQRYNAHTKNYYSVAEHCCLISDWILREFNDNGLALAGLLHDAHEAITGDLTSPMQNVLELMNPGFKSAFRDLQHSVDTTILRAFGLDVQWEDRWCPEEIYDVVIREADTRIITDEQNQTMCRSPYPDNGGWPSQPALGVTLQFWGPQQARREWHERLGRLVNSIRGF